MPIPDFETLAPLTAAQFPHVIARLKTLWADHDRCAEFFRSLLMEGRPDSQGFPPAVLLELIGLNEVFLEKSKREVNGPDVWSKHEPML